MQLHSFSRQQSVLNMTKNKNAQSNIVRIVVYSLNNFENFHQSITLGINVLSESPKFLISKTFHVLHVYNHVR